MRAVFTAIDGDGDGQLTVAEVHGAATGGRVPQRALPQQAAGREALQDACRLWSCCLLCYPGSPSPALAFTWAKFSAWPLCPSAPRPPRCAALGLSVAAEDSQRMVELLDADMVCS